MKNDVRKPIHFDGSDLYLSVSNYYYGDNLAVLAYTTDGELWGDITANLSEIPIVDVGGAYINDITKYVGLEKELINKGIIERVVSENVKYNMGKYDYVIFNIDKLKEYDPIGFVNKKIKPFFVYYDGKNYNLYLDAREFKKELFKKYNGEGDHFDLELVSRLFIHKNLPKLKDDAWFVDGIDFNVEIKDFENIKTFSTLFSKVYNDEKQLEKLIEEAMPYYDDFIYNPITFGYSFDKKVNI